MKKLLGILVLCSFLNTNSYSSSDLMVPDYNYPGLKGVKEFNLNIDSAKQDLLDYNLDIDFDSVDQLYIETRKETISNAIASHWMGI